MIYIYMIYIYIYIRYIYMIYNINLYIYIIYHIYNIKCIGEDHNPWTRNSHSQVVFCPIWLRLFHLSIGIRWYKYIINHLEATGGLIRGLRPNERSVASRLHDALEAKGFRAGGFTAIFSLNKICWLIYDHVIGILSSNSLSHFRDWQSMVGD